MKKKKCPMNYYIHQLNHYHQQYHHRQPQQQQHQHQQRDCEGGNGVMEINSIQRRRGTQYTSDYTRIT